MVTANLWKIENNTYSIQFNKVNPKDKKVIFKLLNDWKETGIGFHKDGTELYIFSKTLLEEENIYNSLKHLPFPLTEEKKNGSIKTIKTKFKHTKRSTSLTKQEKSAKIKEGRSCSKCGRKGHNSRTCKNDISQPTN